LPSSAGAGPAGLTAALELLRQSDITPLVFEADTQVGGISKTINYRGNRMDLGGHRFFSKSDWVMRWWQEILPVAQGDLDDSDSLRISYQGESRNLAPDRVAPEHSHAVMLMRRRLSSHFLSPPIFFDYPLALNASTLGNLGITEALKIGASYGMAQLRRSIAGIFIGGTSSSTVSASASIRRFQAYREGMGRPLRRDLGGMGRATNQRAIGRKSGLARARQFFKSDDAMQRHAENSLIERFLYPKFGPGQMWEEVARRVSDQGGNIHLRHRIAGIEQAAGEIKAVKVVD